MDKYQETFRTWNNIASLYEEKFMDLDIYNETYDLICASAKKGAALLDVGCGPGNITKYLLSKRPDFSIHGIDIAPNMITLARKNNPLASFEVMDCREIATLSTSFDGIIGGFCMPYMSEAESGKFIKDCHHLLKASGLLYLSFVEGDAANSGYKTGKDSERVYFYYHNLEVVKDKLIQAGFQDIQVWKVEYGKPETPKDTHTIITTFKKS